MISTRKIIRKFIDYSASYLYEDFCFSCEDENNDEFQNIFHLILDDFHLNYSFQEYLNDLDSIKKMLDLDLEAAYNGDPAAVSKTEIILTYPGFYAIMVYRIAHLFANLKTPLLPRMMTEIAHSGTGIDINPNAKIGSYFFIDHGTGVVIGETAEIGNHVRIYQGVTIGALSLKDVDKVRGTKRHPTIKDNVIIYSGASILGGNTVIGNNVIIGSNVFLTSSIPDNKKVRLSTKNYLIEDI